MKKILFYYPSNKRSIQVETTLLELKKLGHQIYLLTTCERGQLHDRLEKEGISIQTSVYNKKTAFGYYLFQIKQLAITCKKLKIDFVFGNLQHTNFISVLAQPFLQARVINFRHHFKFSKGNFGIDLEINRNELLFDKVINKFSRKIVVPSEGVFNGMKNFEKVNLSKISIIPYLYDFSQYKSPKEENVEEIRKKFDAKLLVIMVARLIPFKRHLQVLPTYKKMIDSGFDLQVIILDEGPEMLRIKKYIIENKLENSIHLIGFTTQFLEYMAASDILIHPSLTEASNNVVKEMGLMKKAVAICQGVGDFDEYIQDGNNGYLMNIEKPEVDVERILTTVYQNKIVLQSLGNELHKTIQTKFGNNKQEVIQLYQNLIRSYA